MHDPIGVPGASEPVNATVVQAKTFLHPVLPQPDSGYMYRCLTEFPGRTPGCLVPLSTLNYELDDGRLWPQVADWRTVVQALIALTRIPGQCEAMPLALSPTDAALLGGGPYLSLHAPGSDGDVVLGTRERRALIASITSKLPTATGDPPLWPGDGLVRPPCEPDVMPYQPHGS